MFTGVGTANAISPSAVVVSWPDAFNAQGNPASSSMIYHVYRSTNPAVPAIEANRVTTTSPGITSFVDVGLPDFTTLYYRVVAEDASGNRSNAGGVTSARTPSVFSDGRDNIDYARDIEPLWSTAAPNGDTCIGCHDGSSAGGRLDLSSFEGLMIGVGTQQNPDPFVIAYDGEATWNEFVFRFVANAADHSPYFQIAAQLQTWEDPLADWADEGSLETPDTEPPVFEFDNIVNAGRYHGRFVDFQTVEVTWFHASDPESLPSTGSTLGQLEYYIYAGEDSDTIDWDNPVAGPILSEELLPGNETMSTTFVWAFDRIAAVVRAVDASGRSTVVPPIGDPGYLEALKKRLRNMSVNEREIRLAR